MLLRFLAILGLTAGTAWSQLSQDEAKRIAETLLSNQNPLVVIEEVAHDGLTVTPQGNGYLVQVAGPRLPARIAFAPQMDLTLTPIDSDLVQIQVTSLAKAADLADGGKVSFRPTVFQGAYSRRDAGFASLQFGLSDLAYEHPVGGFSMERFETDLRLQDGEYRLKLSAQGFAADFQDVMDFQESVGRLDLLAYIDANQGSGADLIFTANRIFELLVDPGAEDTNQSGKNRALPENLLGLRFELSVSDLRSRWLALRDQGPREVMSDVQVRDLFVRGSVDPDSDGRATLLVNFGLNDSVMESPGGLLDGAINTVAMNLTLGGFDVRLLSELLSSEEAAQRAAFSEIVGNLARLDITGLAQGVVTDSPAQEASFALAQGNFRVELNAPYPDAPNYKDAVIALGIDRLELTHPALVAGLEPAWTNLLAPALPKTLELRLSIKAVPGDLWKGIAALLFDTDLFPQDRTAPDQATELILDGTRYASELVNAELGGTLTLDPAASPFVLGNMTLEMNNLRTLIAAMQRSARIPDRTLAQFLTLGSVALATIAGYAPPSADGTQSFDFEFQQSGFPTINGRPLPVGF